MEAPAADVIAGLRFTNENLQPVDVKLDVMPVKLELQNL